ncbi:MAG: NAD(P)H-dependent oxidoreductase [Clostridia bacterium]|nr:NAD(P)H-dependent oxidoreductase [Clostridia bacterium]MCI2001056.1 NAD(P)H-dependent oxidoreductase [Clostridia bacterium]MCI2015655.1 NAD(P)H-dependent oxidoreductase [Clostridia bacterium]
MKILFIDACMRAEDSRTLNVAKKYIEKIQKKYDCIVETVKLYEMRLLPYYAEDIKFRDELIGKGDFENEFFSTARQFSEADMIVISAPYWDLSFPSALKVYFEHVSVLGIAFKYDKNGKAVGLIKAKKTVYITTSGGYIGKENHGFSYVSSLFKLMYGVNKVDFISAEALDVYPEKVEKIIKHAKDEIDKIN